MMGFLRSATRGHLAASLMGGLILLSISDPVLAADPKATTNGPAREGQAATTTERLLVPREMLTECIQNAVAGAVFGGPAGFSPYLMGALGCGLGGLSAVMASGIVDTWTEPEAVTRPIKAAWNALPEFNTASVATGVLTAPLMALASVSDVAGALFAPVIGQPDKPGVMVAEAGPAPRRTPEPEALMAGHYQPGIGTGWRPIAP